MSKPSFSAARWIWRPDKNGPHADLRYYPAVTRTMKRLLTPEGQSLSDEHIAEILSALPGAGMDETPLSMGLADAADGHTELGACRILKTIRRVRPDEAEEGGEYPRPPGGRDRHRFPLCIAVQKELRKLATTMLQEGFPVNVMDGRRMTPLAYAARNGDSETAKLLLDAGADPFLGSLRMRTIPLCAAAEAPNDKDVHDILNVILDAEWTKDENWKFVLEEHLTHALSTSISNRRYDVAYLFLDAGANPVMPVAPHEKGPHDELLAGIRRRCGREEEHPTARPLILQIAISAAAELEAKGLFNRMMSVMPPFVLRERFTPIEEEFRAAMKAAYDPSWKPDPNGEGSPRSGISHIVSERIRVLGDGESVDLVATARSLRMSNIPELRAAAKLLGLPDPMEERLPKEERLSRAVAVLEECWIKPAKERLDEYGVLHFGSEQTDKETRSSMEVEF